MTKLALITGPTGRVVSAEDLRVHARIDSRDEDDYLCTLLDAAEDDAEEYTWRKFLTQTWDQYFDAFADPLYLPYPPLSSIESITYTDTSGDTQTLATTVYEAGEENGIGTVRRKYNQSWPASRSHEDAVKVRFVCGYGDEDDVPERIKHAIRLHAAWFFRNREGEMVLPGAFRQLLSSFQASRFLQEQPPGTVRA